MARDADRKLEQNVDLDQLLEDELGHLNSKIEELQENERYRDLISAAGLSVSTTNRDPFVNIVLQGYAFLAARVKHKLNEEFPRFTQNLLSVVCPPLAAPTPSMIVARFDVRKDKALLAGTPVERGQQLTLRFERRRGGRQHDVIFTTGRRTILTPLEVTEVKYLPDEASLQAAGATLPDRESPPAAGVMVTLSLGMEGSLSEVLNTDHLDLYVNPNSGPGGLLFEALALSSDRAEVKDPERRRGPQSPATWIECSPLGYEAHNVEHDPVTGINAVRPDSLLPYDARSFNGHRLLHEFFALPARFHFMRLHGLRAAFKNRSANSCNLLFHLSDTYPDLAGRLTARSVMTNCVPAINLFEHTTGDIKPSAAKVEYEIKPDRGDPASYEIHSVTEVIGRNGKGNEFEFRPFFSVQGLGAPLSGPQRYYALSRHERLKAQNEEIADQEMDSYRGSELKISLVNDDADDAETKPETISLRTLCTNRHLPLLAGRNKVLKASAELGADRIEVVAGPSQPRSAVATGRQVWHALNLLSLNYLSLIERPGADAVAPLRQLLRLFLPGSDSDSHKIAEALRGVEVKQVPGRIESIDTDGSSRVAPVTFVRGLEIHLTIDDSPAEAAAMAHVLNSFFASYVSANSFTKTVIKSPSRDKRLAWKPRSGTRTTL